MRRGRFLSRRDLLLHGGPQRPTLRRKSQPVYHLGEVSSDLQSPLGLQPLFVLKKLTIELLIWPRSAGLHQATQAIRSRPHSCFEEPMGQVTSGLIGGLPKDASWLRERGITLLLSAMGKTAAQAGGTSGAPFLQHAVPISHHGQARENAWKDAKQLMLPTLRAGESAYVHCLAGVHRAPVLAALMLAWVSRRTFDDCYRQVEQLRAVDPAGVRERRGGADIFKWAASRAAEDVPQRIPRPPFTWVCSRKRGSLWHIRKGDAPWCQWRQLAPSFKGEVYFADSVEEALGYQRSICKMCKAVLPASMQLRAGN